MFTAKNKNKGQVLVLVALSLVVFLGFAALAIDVAYFYHTRHQLQGAADAAALAGAIELNGTLSAVNARTKAVQYAGLNKAAGDSVVIESDGTNTLNADNDITVGYWDSDAQAYSADTMPVNAIQVKSRRTGDSPGGAAGTFFGKIFGVSAVNISSEAIAVKVLPTTPALALCIKSCNMTGFPKLLDIQSSLDPGSDYGIAWTLFQSGASVPNSSIEKLIDGTLRIDMNQFCSTPPCMTTNNGATESLNNLGGKFRDVNFDSSNKVIVGGVVQQWNIGVGLVDYNCNIGSSDPNQGCPPSKQGISEPFHLGGWAKVGIVEVCDNKPRSSYKDLCTKKGVLINGIQCITCGDSSCPDMNKCFGYTIKSKLVK